MKKIKVWFAVHLRAGIPEGALYYGEKPVASERGGPDAWWQPKTFKEHNYWCRRLLLKDDEWPFREQFPGDEPKPYFLTLEAAEEGE